MLSEIQRIRAIAAEHQLNNVIHSTCLRYINFDKAAFEPVELSVYAEEARKKQVEMFLVDFVTNKKAEIEEFCYEIYEDIKLDESLFHEYNEESMILELPRTRYVDRIENSFPLDVRNLNRMSPTR